MKIPSPIKNHTQKTIIILSIVLILALIHPIYSNQKHTKNPKETHQEKTNNKVAILDQFPKRNPETTQKITSIFKKQGIEIDTYENITLNPIQKTTNPKLQYNNL
ncbi:MAG: hypothetical protein BTN85_1728 [Candidatus Methanohalarchaeum thermophilum]|uniref:Uncharacterized protein n=1 Tax=Methanohalarchaeum thermophilum TaxID=1903181 RepID=A0A1Q6DXZ0_METT1|nr:MAG: hypothetical protein BTN85_1728 [Candidatus Methanohalarchaeum thermophilum]